MNWSQILAANCKNEMTLTNGKFSDVNPFQGINLWNQRQRKAIWVIHTFSCHIISHILVHSLRAINRSGLRTDGLLLSTFDFYVFRFDNHPPRSQWWSYCFQKYHMNCVISMSSLVSQKAYPANSQCCEFPCDYEDSIGEHKHNCELKSLLFVEFYFFSPLCEDEQKYQHQTTNKDNQTECCVSHRKTNRWNLCLKDTHFCF